MKFVCLKCEKHMSFQSVEMPAAGQLGVKFRCESCATEIAMVTNPGETQLVSSLGVELGGRSQSSPPLEMTDKTLAKTPAANNGFEAKIAAHLKQEGTAALEAYLTEAEGSQAPDGASDAAPAKDPMAGCPFSTMMQQMGISRLTEEDRRDLRPYQRKCSWTEAASASLAHLPSFVGDMMAERAERYALRQGVETIDEALLEASRGEWSNKLALDWSEDALERLEKVPDFIRPAAQVEIERMARELGESAVTSKVMDAVKDRFQF